MSALTQPPSLWTLKQHLLMTLILCKISEHRAVLRECLYQQGSRAVPVPDTLIRLLQGVPGAWRAASCLPYLHFTIAEARQGHHHGGPDGLVLPHGCDTSLEPASMRTHS